MAQCTYNCISGCNCNHYGFFNFIWDIFMVFLTCGFWLIWIFVREMRK